MFKMLKNKDGFSGLLGIIIMIAVIGIMSAMLIPTFSAKMNYKQARYVSGVINVIQNAENAYMAKNGAFLDLTDLGFDGYLSPAFLKSISATSVSYTPSGSTTTYYTSTWQGTIENKTVNGCITDYPSSIFSSAGTGCPNNPGNAGGYFLEISNIPVGSSSINYANYIAGELPGSGIGSQGGGLEYVAYAAPVPSAPPANASGATPAAKYTKTWLSPCTDSLGNPTYCTWTVPSGVTVISVTLAGGNGGGYGYGNSSGFVYFAAGGIGDELSDQLLNVSPGETLNIYVGQDGNGDGGGFGYGGGGGGGNPGLYSGGAGGGGSSAVVNPNTVQVIMAPGGYGYGYGAGGGGGYNGGTGGNGGYYNGYTDYANGAPGGAGYYGGGGGGGAGYGSVGGGAPGGPGGVGAGGDGAPGGAGNGYNGAAGAGGGYGGYGGIGGGYNNETPSGIIPGPGYPFVEIQWN